VQDQAAGRGDIPSCQLPIYWQERGRAADCRPTKLSGAYNVGLLVRLFAIGKYEALPGRCHQQQHSIKRTFNARDVRSLNKD